VSPLKLSPDVQALNPDVTAARLPGASKYGAKPDERDGEKFDSRAEAERYDELCLLQRAGEITRLETHPTYALRVNGIDVCRYVADFRYLRDGHVVVEDVKGVRTDVYKLKARLMQAIHGITILETEVSR
jgi:hypothetical protein